MKAFNVGIIGYGWAASAHIPAINATGQARVTSILSSRRLDDSQLAARHGSPIRSFANLDDFLAQPGLDVVDITSRPGDHPQHAIAAARAGKQLILEKPVALSWSECRRVEQAVRRAGVRVCVCFECRYSGQFRTIKSVIDQGLLGVIHYGEVDYYHGIGPGYGQYRWNVKRTGGGSSLLSAGGHALDALLLCLGGEVESVASYATGSQNADFARYEYPTTSVTILRFADGRVGKCASCIDCLQPYYFHTHLIGSAGSLLDQQFHSNKFAALDPSKWSRLSLQPVDSGDVSDHPYQTQFTAFFQALAEGRDMPLTSLADALATHRVIFAADKSAALGRPVRLKSIPW